MTPDQRRVPGTLVAFSTCNHSSSGTYLTHMLARICPFCKSCAVPTVVFEGSCNNLPLVSPGLTAATSHWKERGMGQSTSHHQHPYQQTQSVGQQQTPKADRELGMGGQRAHSSAPTHLSRKSNHQSKTEPSYTLLPDSSRRRGMQCPTPGPA